MLITGFAVLHQQIVLLKRPHVVLEVMNALVAQHLFLTGQAVPKVLVHVLIIGCAVLHQQIVPLRRQHAALEAMNVLVVQKIVRP